MPRRYFNWKLAIVLVIGIVVLAVTAYGLRQWRRGSRAERGLILGNKAYEEHRYEEAVPQLGHYLAVERDDVPILLKYADAHLNIRPLKRNNIQQAIAAYRVVLREDKNNYEAAAKLTELYLAMGMPGEAELIASRYLDANHEPELRRMLALAMTRQRKFDEAAMELKNIIAQNPDRILAYETLGQLTEQRPADFPDSNDWFSEAVKNNPSSALAYIIRAAFHLRNNDRAKALADLEQAEKLDLSEPVVRLRFAGEFINANIFDKAEEHLEAVQATEPASQNLWRIWTTLALKSNSKEMMLKVADTGLKELSYQPWDFMSTAAELYIRCGRLDHADDCISKLNQKGIAPSTTAFLEGLLADRKGQDYKAVKCWYEIGNKSPRVRLALASVLSRSGDILSALRQLRILVSESPAHFNGRMAFARMLAQMGDWTEAAEQAQEAGKISPDSLDAALLSIQARIQLIAERQTDNDSPVWQDIDTRLARLEEATNGALNVKLLQLQCAVMRDKFVEAETLIAELKKVHPSDVKIALAQAELLTVQAREDQAAAALNKIIGEFPQSVDIARYLAVLLARQGDHERCEAVIKDVLTRTEQPAAKREMALLLAGFYDRWKEHEKRYRLLDSLVRELPDDIPVHRELLKCERVMKEPDRAQQLVDKIKTIEGEKGWQWRYEQARIWFTKENFENRYPRITSLLKENLLNNPDDQASRMLLARSYERAGEMKLAIANYRDAYNRSPRDIRVIVAYVSALYYKAKEYEVVDEILQKAAGEKLYHPELKKFEFQRYLRRGEFGLAGDALEDLLTDDPNNIAVLLSLARIKIWQNKLAEAEQLIDRLKILEPNSLPTAAAQIDLNVRRGKSDEAITLCDEQVNKHNNALAYILRAKTYVSIGESNEAMEDFEHAVTIEPENVGAWVAKSDFYSSTHLEKAIADIQKALSLAPGNLRIQKRAISLFLASKSPGRVREVKRLLEKALESNPEDIDLRLFKARLLLDEGTAPADANAAGILQKITRDRPAISEPWVLLGGLSLKQAEYDEALNIAIHGLVHKPKDRALLLLKARALKELSPALAIPTIKLLHEMEPNDVNTVVLLANTHIEADEPEKAVNLLKKQLVSCTNTADERKVKFALVKALYKNGDKTEFQKELDSLLQAAPDDPNLLIVQVQLLKDDKIWEQLNNKLIDWYQNHPQDTQTLLAIAGDLAMTEDSQAEKIAEDMFRRILADDPGSLPAMGSLAMLLQMTGRHEEAAGLYRSILKVQPDNVIVINNLAWLMCEEQGRHREALALAQRGLKIAPSYIDLIDTRGVAYYRLGRFEEAAQDFDMSLKLYPKGTPAAAATYFHLGRALFELGQKEKAIENLKKALELNAEIKVLSPEDAEEAQRLIDKLMLGD